jgi:hypothetical protein
MPSSVNATVFGVLLSFAVLAPTYAVARQQQTQPAVWRDYDMIVDLQVLPQRYACDDLWYKFRDILLSIGARPKMEIIPYRCSSVSPRVQIRFSLPYAVNESQVRLATLQAVNGTVRLEAGHPRSLDASDCALLQQLKNTLFAALPMRVVSYRFTCEAPPSSRRRFRLSVQVLTATPRSQRQGVARNGGAALQSTPAAKLEHNR